MEVSNNMKIQKIKMIKENDLFQWGVGEVFEEIRPFGEAWIPIELKFYRFVESYHGVPSVRASGVRIPADELVRTGYAIYLD